MHSTWHKHNNVSTTESQNVLGLFWTLQVRWTFVMMCCSCVYCASAAMAYSTFCYSMLTMQLPSSSYFDRYYSDLFLRCHKNMQMGTSLHWIQLQKKWDHSPHDVLLLVCYSCILSPNEQKKKQVFQTAAIQTHTMKARLVTAPPID